MISPGAPHLRRGSARRPILVAAALALSCSRAAPPSPSAHPSLATVKNVLVGLPPTDEELRAVDADPTRLAPLIDGWMATPGYQRKMRRFFELAFQQTQLNANDFADQVFAVLGRNAATTPLLLRNVEESFARTMVELTAQGRPLGEAMTTRQLMMTTALKELYGLLDAVDIDNEGNYFDTFRPGHRDTPIVVGAAQGPIPLAETLDPASPRYMHWYDPDVATEETIPECQQDPVFLAPSALVLHFLLLGSVEGRRLASGAFCPGYPGTARGPQLTAADFDDWTMVTLRPPAPGEPVTPFYDLPALRRARELVLAQPRLGFFTTPAFFANWPTNTSNQMRVTVNQALIVATGASIDSAPATAAPGAPGLDAAHSRDAACQGCHLALDPTRSIFASTFSWHYHTQRDPVWAGQRGLFAFGGVVAPVATLADFGEVLARHPLVASGWTQKLCQYVTSAPCDEQDPELQRVVERFRASGLSWRTLVETLLTSPVVTGAGGRGGATVSVARRDHLCAALEARLALPDPCGLAPSGQGEPTTIARIASGLPSDAYGRGSVLPILPTDPTLFFVAGVENICKELAPLVIDAPGRPWTSADPDAAIAGFVAHLMGLGASDRRSARARALLTEHFQAAAAQPAVTAREALQSTFVVACQAPSVLSVGF